MNYRHRIIEETLKETVQSFPVTAVLGARQTGKTTLVEEILGSKFTSITFDSVQDIGGARRDPELFIANNPGPLFLDEIQYAPELTGTIKRIVDQKKQSGMYIISGSQHLSILKNLADSMAGRVAIIDLYPLSLSELTGDLNRDVLYQWVNDPGKIPETSIQPEKTWHEIMWRGGFPNLMDIKTRMIPRYFSGYERTYIERDVRRISNIGDLQLFNRFFRLLAGLSSCEIIDSKLGHELGIDRRTAAVWRSILSNSYQWLEIPAYTRNAVKRVAGKSKGYVTDTGLMCHQLYISEPGALATHPLLGRIVETWLFMEIYKTVQGWPIQPGFYHYRTVGGAEIDLILEYNGKLFPIEIKHTSNPAPRDLRGFQSFRETYPKENIAPGLVFCGVKQPRWITRSELALPWWMI